MQDLWQRIQKHSSWFWGAVGALCVAAVLLAVSLPPQSEMAGSGAAATLADGVFHGTGATPILSLPVIPSAAYPSAPDSIVVDYITFHEQTTDTNYIAYKQILPDILQEEYKVTEPPTSEDALRVFRVLYQSAPYLKTEETVALLAQKGLENLSGLTENDIVAAAQLAIVSIINGWEYDFTEVDGHHPLVRPLYEYYMAIPAEVPAVPIGFRIDATHAMWASGTTFGPMRILPSVDGYAHGATFNLVILPEHVGDYTFRDGMNQPITSIGVGEPFYLRLNDQAKLPDAGETVGISAAAASIVSHGGEAFALNYTIINTSTVESDAESIAETAAESAVESAVESAAEGDAASAAAQYGPILPGMLFSAQSLRDMPRINATIEIQPNMGK